MRDRRDTHFRNVDYVHHNALAEWGEWYLTENKENETYCREITEVFIDKVSGNGPTDKRA